MNMILLIMIVKMKNALSELNSAKVFSGESAESFPKLLTSDEIPSSPQMNNSNILRALSMILPFAFITKIIGIINTFQ